MALETGTFISDLNASNPASVDGLAAADDHMRLIKATIKATFPNITGAVTATQAELNLLDGVTATTPEINILDGVTSTATELNLVDGATAGTIVNSKAVVYGSSGEVNATTLQVSGTAITATPAELNVLDGITASTTELNFMDGVTSNVQTQLNNVSVYPQVITILTSGNYSIPSDAQAIMIRASGGGGGGSTAFQSGGGLGINNGSNGGNTTVTNSTLSIAVTATGGRFGEYSTGGSMDDIITGSTGGDVLNAQGAAGGRSRAGTGGNFTYDGPPDNGMAGNLVHKYVTGNNVGGQTLTISYGAAGASGDSSSTAGQAGYVEIWVW